MNYNDIQRKKQIERVRTYGPRHLTHIQEMRKQLEQAKIEGHLDLPQPVQTTVAPDNVIEKLERELPYYSKAYGELIPKLKALQLPIERYKTLILVLSRCRLASKPTTIPTELQGKHLTQAKYTHHLGKIYATSRIKWLQYHGKEPLFSVKGDKDLPRGGVTDDIQFLLDLYYGKAENRDGTPTLVSDKETTPK